MIPYTKTTGSKWYLIILEQLSSPKHIVPNKSLLYVPVCAYIMHNLLSMPCIYIFFYSCVFLYNIIYELQYSINAHNHIIHNLMCSFGILDMLSGDLIMTPLCWCLCQSVYFGNVTQKMRDGNRYCMVWYGMWQNISFHNSVTTQYILLKVIISNPT